MVIHGKKSEIHTYLMVPVYHGWWKVVIGLQIGLQLASVATSSRSRDCIYIHIYHQPTLVSTRPRSQICIHIYSIYFEHSFIQPAIRTSQSARLYLLHPCISYNFQIFSIVKPSSQSTYYLPSIFLGKE